MELWVRSLVAGALLPALAGCLIVHEEKIPVAPAAAVAAAPPPVLAPIPPPPSPPVRERIESVAAPTYISIPMEITVNKPAAEVWKRVGKYCDIAEWFQIATGCQITAGKDGEVGAVRTVGSEILVGRTELSYTYTQPVRDGRPYNLYHGTLEARPINARTSKLVYTLMYDNSLVPGDAAAKQAEIDRRKASFERALANMKILAEGGTLPPPPPRPAAAPAAPAAPASGQTTTLPRTPG
jgi:hypothetical protein